MARIRSVHPDICTSETMAHLPAEVERTFVRLWTHCDDHGRALDNPKLLKAALYPLHDDVTAESVARDLDVLENVELVVRYTVDGKRYLFVRSWGEFQKPQHPAKSKHPEPPEPSGGSREDVPDLRTEPEKPQETVLRAHEPLTPVVGVGVGEGEGVVLPAPPSVAVELVEPAVPATRQRSPLFDALVEACGWLYDEMTEMQRRATGTAAAQLVKVGATPAEVHRRAAEYRERFPNMSFTPHAIAKHWASLTPRSRPSGTNGTVLSKSEQAFKNAVDRRRQAQS